MDHFLNAHVITASINSEAIPKTPFIAPASKDEDLSLTERYDTCFNSAILL